MLAEAWSGDAVLRSVKRSCKSIVARGVKEINSFELCKQWILGAGLCKDGRLNVDSRSGRRES